MKPWPTGVPEVTKCWAMYSRLNSRWRRGSCGTVRVSAGSSPGGRGERARRAHRPPTAAPAGQAGDLHAAGRDRVERGVAVLVALHEPVVVAEDAVPRHVAEAGRAGTARSCARTGRGSRGPGSSAGPPPRSAPGAASSPARPGRRWRRARSTRGRRGRRRRRLPSGTVPQLPSTPESGSTRRPVGRRPGGQAGARVGVGGAVEDVDHPARLVALRVVGVVARGHHGVDARGA